VVLLVYTSTEVQYKLRDIYTSASMGFALLGKISPNMAMAIMAVLVIKSTYILKLFMVLLMTWAVDKTMSTQVELQQDDVALVSKYKKKTRHPVIKRLQNTNSFLLVECSSADLSGQVPSFCSASRNFPSS